METGQVNIYFKRRRIAYDNSEKLVGQAICYSTIPYASIIAYAAKAARVPESSIILSMEALFDAMNFFVLNGHSVKIPNLGTFYLSVRMKSAATKEEFIENFEKNLRHVTIRFLPDPEMKTIIASTAIKTLVE